MFELDTDLFDQYLCDSRETLEILVEDLQSIEKRGACVNEELLDHAFRALHTVKECSQLFDLRKIGELSQKTEVVLSLVCSHQIAPTADLIAILLYATDRLCELLGDPNNSDQADIADVVVKLEILSANVLTSSLEGAKSGGNNTQDKKAHLRMLVVEDDFACRFLLQKFLSRFGECHIAVNGKEAVDAYRIALGEQCSYDLICMDVMMPEMGGREAVRQIRALEVQRGIISSQGARIIMTTTVNELQEVANCYEELCDDYLVKPINLAQLRNRMEQFQLL